MIFVEICKAKITLKYQDKKIDQLYSKIVKMLIGLKDELRGDK